MPDPKPVSTPRTRRHRQLLRSVGLRYRSVLVHDLDVEAVKKYAARLLRKRHPTP